MKYPNYRWIDVAIGGAAKRNNLVDVSKFRPPAKAVDAYRTVFRYPDAMREHFEKHKTVAGYNGYVYADWFPLDIDSGDLAQSLATVRQALEQLAVRYDVRLEELRLYFSGAKGFHVLIPATMLDLVPEKEMPQAFKEMAASLFDGVKVDTAIYDMVRLFRLANTINSKTGLYKVPLTPAEIMHESLERILELAKAPRKVEAIAEVDVNPALAELYRACLEKVKQPRQPNNGVRSLAKDVKPCISRLLEGVGEGERDNAGLRIAVHYAKQGLPEDLLVGLLAAWNRRNTPPLREDDIEKLARQAVEKPYDFGCGDVLLKQYCSLPCPVRRQPNEDAPAIERVKSIADAYEAYLDYVANLRKARVKLGFGPLDERMRGIAPGEVCQIIARSAVGKTTLALNILKNASESGIRPIVMFTMEMPLAQVFERMCQITLSMRGQDVEEAARSYLMRQDDRVADFANKVFESYGNVYFVDDDGLSLEDMAMYLKLAEQRAGEPVRLVVVDYMGRMRAGHGSAYEVASRLAIGLKRLAKRHNLAVISLHQISREGGNGTEPVTMDMCRDSGVIEEACDFLIGMWRPEKESAVKAEEEEIKVALLKNRRGYETKTTLIFNKPTLRIYGGDNERHPA